MSQKETTGVVVENAKATSRRGSGYRAAVHTCGDIGGWQLEGVWSAGLDAIRQEPR